MSRFFLYSVAIFLFGLLVVWRIISDEPFKVPRGQYIVLQAKVKSEPQVDGTRQMVKVGDARLYLDLFPRYRVGDVLKIEGEVDQRGNILRSKVQKQNLVDDRQNFFANLRSTISQNIARLLPSREATLLQGTVLGVDTIEKEFKDQLIKTGTIHVVVVSGQNLAIVAGLFMAQVKYLGRRSSLFLATIAVFAYAALTGFEPPVVRASLMVLLTSIAIYLGRQTTPIWNLVLAALIILAIWPWALLEISFQLTFMATLGIITLGQLLAKSWQKIPLVGENAAIATSAYLFTLPIILYYFGKVSPIAPLANIFVAEAIAPIMILGFLIAAASLILMPLAQLLAYLAYVPAFYFVKVVELFAKIPIGQISLGKGSLLIVITFYILIFTLMGIWGRKLKVKSQKSKADQQYSSSDPD